MSYLEGAWMPEQLEGGDFSKSYAPEAAGSYGIPKSWFNDPFAMLDSMGLGYRANPSALGYETLKQMGEKSVIPLAIIQTRVNQTSAFAQRQRNKYSVGMKVQHKDPHHKLTDRDRDHIKNLLGFVENMGVDRDCERDAFDTFVKKCVRDRLIYDQFCAEKVLRRSGKPHSIFAIDSATIRRVAPKDRRGTPLTKREALTTPKYVQVIDGTIANEYTQKELMFRVANPRTDLRVHGYGYSELEMLINTITSHLWAEEWNRKAFCVAPGSYVTTRNGLRLIDDLAGTEFEVWNGRTWSNATAYQTGKKGLVRTKLWNGLELETSQKHRFRVIPRESETGEAVWRTQQELKHGDVALLGYASSDGDLDEASFLVEKEYTSARSWGSPWKVTLEVVKDVEFWEMLGFALGDGYWPELGALDVNGNRKPQWLRTMPHATLDAKVFDLFLRVCDRHGINGKRGVANPLDRRADGEFGYPIVDIQHKAFIEWLYDLGFNSSARGKRIPAVVMQGPVWMRSALLCGLFSADGHTHRHSTKGYATPTVHCSAYPLLRQDILRCLWSVGVASNEVGEGWSRKGEIDVQDVGAFVERIGYLQDYKNANITREPGKASLWDRLHPAWSSRVAVQLRTGDKSIWDAFSSQDRDLICKASRGVCGLSRPKAISFLQRFGLPIPVELHYVHVSVDVLDDEAGSQVQMFDVEVFDEEHTFLLNHVAVHNSQGATTKGILNLQGNIPAAQLDAFRRQFITQVSGVANAWRTPITNSDGLQWIPLQPSNNEMGYQQWLEYLIKVTCFVPGTKVTMADGSRRDIARIEPGDVVRTHTGRAKAVLNVQVKKVCEDVVGLQASGRTIHATQEHPFYVVSSRVNSHMVREFDEPVWVSAKDIVEGQDYLVVPRPRVDGDRLNITRIDLADHVKGCDVEDTRIKLESNAARWVPRYIDLTKENAFLLGLYAAEGHSTKYAVTFCFAKDEVEYGAAVISFAAQFGLEAHDYTQKASSLALRFSNGVIARAFRSLFGRVSPKRRVPTELQTASLEVQQAFLSGVVAGDGSVYASSRSLTLQVSTASRKFADQLQSMFLFQGAHAGVYEQIRKSGFKPGSRMIDLRIEGTQLRQISHWLTGPKGKLLCELVAKFPDLKQRVYATPSSFLVPVTSTWMEPYVGEVYNLEVKDEHTYVVEGFAVHNCSIFLIDPAEVNFDTRGGVGSQPMFMTTNEAQQKISKDRGLQPLLRYVQTLVNEEIIQEIDPEYEFIFVGIDAQTEQQAIELRSKELATYKTLNEIRREEDLAPVEHGDVVLNPVYTGLRQQEQMAAQQAAQATQQGGAPTGGPPPGMAPPGQREQFEKLFGGGNPEKRPSFGAAERALGSHIEGEVKTEATPEEATDDFSQEETQDSWENSVHASLRMHALHVRLSNDVKKAMSAFGVA